MRQCRRCKEYKTLQHFSNNKEDDENRGTHYWCKDCRSKEEEPELPDWQDLRF